MPLLYFWRHDNYRRDLDEGIAFHLNQSSPRLHQIEREDSVWAFTRDAERGYVLAAELVVRAKTRNPPEYKYGPYRVWGDRQKSRYFSVSAGPVVEPLVRAMSLSVGAGVLGRSFQGPGAVRALTEHDHRTLAVFARDLALEPRAHCVDDTTLEHAVTHADPAAIDEVLGSLGVGISPARRQWITREAPARSRAHVVKLRGTYQGRCQLCGWQSLTKHKVDVCEGHHLQWLSRGGGDAIENMVLLCPNHHRLVHALDAPLDFADLAFDLGPRERAPLRFNRHLTRAA